jgi:hypothetical protein
MLRFASETCPTPPCGLDGWASCASSWWALANSSRSMVARDTPTSSLTTHASFALWMQRARAGRSRFAAGVKSFASVEGSVPMTRVRRSRQWHKGWVWEGYPPGKFAISSRTQTRSGAGRIRGCEAPDLCSVARHQDPAYEDASIHRHTHATTETGNSVSPQVLCRNPRSITAAGQHGWGRTPSVPASPPPYNAPRRRRRPRRQVKS